MEWESVGVEAAVCVLISPPGDSDAQSGWYLTTGQPTLRIFDLEDLVPNFIPALIKCTT